MVAFFCFFPTFAVQHRGFAFTLPFSTPDALPPRGRGRAFLMRDTYTSAL